MIVRNIRIDIAIATIGQYHAGVVVMAEKGDGSGQ